MAKPGYVAVALAVCLGAAFWVSDALLEWAWSGGSYWALLQPDMSRHAVHSRIFAAAGFLIFGVFTGLVLAARSRACGDLEQRVRERTAELSTSEERWRSLVSAAPHLIMIVDADGTIRFLNRPRRGVSADELLGKNVCDYIEPQHVPSVRECFADVLKRGHGAQMEVRAGRPGEQKKWYAMRVSPYEQDGRIVGLSLAATDITQRQEADEMLRMTRFSIDRAMDSVLWVGRDGGLMDANQTACRKLGYSREQLLGMSLSDIDLYLPQEVWSEHWEEVEQCGTLCMESFHRTKSGTVFPVEVVAHNQRFGEREYNCLFVRDITRRKQIEQSLREGEARFHLATLATRDAVYDWDIVCDSAWANQRYGELFGPVESPFYAWWRQRLHPDERGLTLAALQQTLDGGSDHWSAEFRFKLGDGGYAHVLDRGFIIRDPAGRAVRMIGAMTDITERKQAEDALRENRDVLQAIIEGTQDIVYLKDLNGRLRLVNTAAAELVRKSPSELHGKTDYDIFSAEDAHQLHEQDRRVIDTGEPLTLEHTLQIEGSPRFFSTNKAPQRDALGKIVGVIAIQRDITKLKQAHEQLQQSERLASIGTLAAGIAHEINNPTGGILVAAQAALSELDRPGGGEFVRKCLSEISEDARRCGQIVKSVLRFARQQPTEKWPNDVNKLVKRAADHATGLIKGVVALPKLELGEDVSEVQLNPTEFTQIVTNLIGNAVEIGGAETRVTVRTQKLADAVRLSVADDGPGMSPEQLKHIFDPFYTTRQRKGGTGLGLSVVHGIVQAHGGQISVESEPGRGTTFTIDLPC